MLKKTFLLAIFLFSIKHIYTSTERKPLLTTLLVNEEDLNCIFRIQLTNSDFANVLLLGTCANNIPRCILNRREVRFWLVKIFANECDSRISYLR